MSATTVGTATADPGDIATGRAEVATMAVEPRRINQFSNAPRNPVRFVTS